MTSPEEDKFLDPHDFTGSVGSQHFFDPHDMEETDNTESERLNSTSTKSELLHHKSRQELFRGSRNSENSLQGQRATEVSGEGSDDKTSKASFNIPKDSFKTLYGGSVTVEYEAQPFTDSNNGVIPVEASGQLTQSFEDGEFHDIDLLNKEKPRTETDVTIYRDCIPAFSSVATSPHTTYPLNSLRTDSPYINNSKVFKTAISTTTTPYASPRMTPENVHAPYASSRITPEEFHDAKELGDDRTTNTSHGQSLADELAHAQHRDVHTLPSIRGHSKHIRYDSPLSIDRRYGLSNHSYSNGDSGTSHERTSIQGGYTNRNGEDGYSSDENTPLLTKGQPKVYKRRWYVLAIFCLTSALQALGWGTWGPITQSAKAVFRWTDANIALLALWGNLSYIFFSVPICILVEKKGLRFSMITCVALQAAGLGMRCITSTVPLATWLMNIGQIFLGAGAVVPFSAVSLFSVTWFPVTQRTTATSIATLFNYLGISLGFIIGPLVVPEPADGVNATENATEIARQETAIMNYMYIVAGTAAFILLLVLIYFPSHPPTPPSITAHIERLQLKEGIKHLARSKNFLLVLMSFCVGTGVYGSFSIILDIDVKPLGVSQETAGWMGFYGSIGGCFAMFAFSWISDKFPRHLKLLLMVMLVPCLATLIWFLLMVGEYIEHDTGSLYITTIVPGVMIFGSTALFYELACEASYPADEGVTTLVMTVVNNISGSVFFAILLVPNLGVAWMNWFLAASVVLCIVLLLVSRVQYRRTNIDMEVTIPEPEANMSNVPAVPSNNTEQSVLPSDINSPCLP